MIRLARVTEHYAEQLSVLFRQVEFGMHRYTQSRFEIPATGKSLSAYPLLLPLHHFVVRLDNRFLAGEVVIRGALRHIRAGCHVLHGCRVKTLFTKKLKRTPENVSSCLLALIGYRIIFDHGQIVTRKLTEVKLYFD